MSNLATMPSQRMAEAVDPDDAQFTSDVAITTGVDAKDADPDGALFLRLRDMAKEAIEHWRPRWEEMNAEYDLYAGKQWSDDDKRVLERQLRPMITFNRISPIIDSLVGLEINNRERVTVFPRKAGEAKQSELWTAGLSYVRDQANAEAEEADAFFDLSCVGVAWTEQYLRESTMQPNAYDIGIDRVDPTEMAADRASKKRNFRDARYLVRLRSIPMEAAKELFDDTDERYLHAGWATYLDDSNDPSRVPESYLFNSPANVGSRRGNVVIVEIQWWEYAPYFMVVDPFTGGEIHMDKASFDEAKRRLALARPGHKLVSAKYRKRIYKRAFLGTRVLKQPQLPCPYDFSYLGMTGKRDKVERSWFGLVRSMRDPQMWANKWLSQILHILNSNAKGGLMASKDTFEDWKKVEKNWANPQFIAWLKAGKKPGEDVGYRQQAAFPQGVFELLNFAMQSVPDANGTSAELLGLADRDQPSSLEWQRRQAGMTVLGIFFNSLRMYRKAQGKYILYMMQKWLADGRLVRVAADVGDEQYVPLLANPDEAVIEYDLIVDESPATPNQKEMVWSILVQAMPILTTVALPPEIWLELLKYSPLPASLVAKFADQSKQGDPEGAKQQQLMQQATLALMGAQVKQLEGQAAESAADVVAKQAKAAKDQTEAKGQELDNVIKRTAGIVAALEPTQSQTQPSPGLAAE